MRRRLALTLALACIAVAAAPRIASAKPGAGTKADPVRIDAFPYAIRGTTQGAASTIDAFTGCSDSDVSGPEVVYEFELDAPARVTAWVSGDGGAVDIDVHLLEAKVTADACVARGNKIAEAALPAGKHYVVVDSFEGAAQAGPFVLHVDAIGDAWTERPIGEGVTWRARRFASGPWGKQVVHELIVDTATPGVAIRARQSNGCQTVAAMATPTDAVAAVNGGFFDTTDCSPKSLLKTDGKVVHQSDIVRAAFGVAPGGKPLVANVPGKTDWPAAEQAHGGVGLLVAKSKPFQGDAAWDAQKVYTGSFRAVNPRTFAGFDAQGRAHLATADGRRANAEGMSLDELAKFAVSSEIGMTDAMNLDGGGSSTMWVRGATPNGVVNYPSDAGATETQEHAGSRGTSGGFFVSAKPFNHAPRFQTTAPTTASVGATYVYDADAIDIDVDDTIAFSLEAAEPGVAIDATSGEVTFEPEVTSKPVFDLVVVATDDHGKSAKQTTKVTVAGATGPVDPEPSSSASTTAASSTTSSSSASVGVTTTVASAGAGGSDVAGAGGGAAGEGGGSPADGGGAEDEGGCACATVGRGGAANERAFGFAAIGLAAAGLASARRRRRV